MQPKVKPRTAWAIVDVKNGIIVPWSIRSQEDACISDMCKKCGQHWDLLQHNHGYRCIKVDIVPADEGK